MPKLEGRHLYLDAQRWVVKIGSAMITNHGLGIDHQRIKDWVADIAHLHRSGKQVVLVSSGAVAAGMQRLGLSARPDNLADLQAAAAVGQMGLLEAYEAAFQAFDLKTAQVLITHEDCADRRRYLNIRMTVNALLSYGVIPIVNENDVVAFDEIRFGDNDSIGAMMANLVDAGLYVILTDQQGFYDANPAENPNAQLIRIANAGDKTLLALASGGGRLGSGGMQTKLLAAQRAAQSGTATIIAPGSQVGVIGKLHAGDEIGTFLVPEQDRQTARKQWLMSRLQVRGNVVIDAGAVHAIVEQGRSILPVGIKQIAGDFSRGDLLSILNEEGAEIARGISNYGAQDLQKIAGKRSEEVRYVLGHDVHDEFIHRDNMVLV